MKSKYVLFFAVVSVMFFSCTKVPVTGRKQLNLLPESQMMAMSVTGYKDVLTKNQSKVLPATDSRVQMVRNVGAKISAAVNKYLSQHQQSKRVQGFKWEYNVIDDNTVNAWCMSGGKIVFYTGILPVTQDETGLAVVMGHEIAHAIARHGNERMSQGLAVQTGGMAVQVALSQKPALTQNLFLQSYGIASELGMLKYSRTHESEADKMGLIFMAMAGYNPSKAAEFWQRMSKLGGGKTLEILSTHPSDETRIKDIQAFLPKALKYYTGK
ncbi:MAG: M48 family metallopeptidase [Bacteroidetes bacterium]|nr:M48 family metallopeptidase [Bacteroidota bacterium]